MTDNDTKARRKAEKLQRRQAKRAAKQEKRLDKLQAKRDAAFYRTPQGAAQLAFNRVDPIFQFSAPLSRQTGQTVLLSHAQTRNVEYDTSTDVNKVIREGWKLVNTTTSFRQTTEQSRDKFMMSGQQTAVSGIMVATYIFEYAPENRVPWVRPSVRDEQAALEEKLGKPVSEINSLSDLKIGYKHAARMANEDEHKPRKVTDTDRSSWSPWL